MFDLTNPIFTDVDKAREHLEGLRWPSGPVCPHCGSTGEAIAKVEQTGKRTKPTPEGKRYRPARKGLYYCNACKEQFSVLLGTVLEKSHIPINKWLAAFFMMCASKKGVSAHQLHRQLHVTYKSAWFMAHRVRGAMRSGGLAPPSSGSTHVEVDETYIGHKKGMPTRRGQGHKFAVLTLVERDGPARSFHVDNTSFKAIFPILAENIEREANVSTDEGGQYARLKRHFPKHETVSHKADEWRRGDVHTNTVENYFSVFKRGMKGVYQHCSEKHLHRYLAEFDFRYSHRAKLGIEDNERTERAIRQIEGRRLTYRRTDGA